jgi:hypothetical protein
MREKLITTMKIKRRWENLVAASWSAENEFNESFPKLLCPAACCEMGTK